MARRDTVIVSRDSCPRCGSKNLKGNEFVIRNGRVYHAKICLDCSKAYEDVYTYVYTMMYGPYKGE